MLSRVCKLFRYQKRNILLAIFFSISMVVVNITWNVLLAQIINKTQRNVAFGEHEVAQVVGLLLLSALCQAGSIYFASYAGEYTIHHLKMNLAKSYLEHPYEVVQNESAGEHISILQNELEEMTQYMTGRLFGLLSDGIQFILTFSFLLKQNLQLTLICNSPLIVIMAYVGFSSKVIHQYVQIEQEKQKHMNGITNVLINVFPIIRIYEAEKLLSNNYHELVSRWQNSAVLEEEIKARLLSLSGMLSCLPLLLLILFGGMGVVEGRLTIGMLYVFVNLSGNVSGIMMNMPGHIAAFRRFCSNTERVLLSMEY